MLNYDPEEESYVVNITKEQLQAALQIQSMP